MPKTKEIKHKKPKKEKKQKTRMRQKQSQHQVVNIHIDNNGDGDMSKKKKHIPLPVQLASSIFNPSLITPTYGINDRQPVNPPNPDVSDVDHMTNLILSGISGMMSQQSKKPEETQPKPEKPNPIPEKPVITQPVKMPEKPVVIPTPKPTPKIPEKPVVISPPKIPEKPVVISPPKIPEKPIVQEKPKIHEPGHNFNIEEILEEVKKKANKHKEKIIVKPQEVESVTVDPIPQDEPEEPNKEIVTDVMGFDPKYDGLKLKNKTVPWSNVGVATGKGIALGVGLGFVGGRVLHNIATTAATTAAGTVGSAIGYKIAGAPGAYIGGIGASSAVAGSGLMNRGTGSMTMTVPREPMGRGRPIVPRPPRPTLSDTPIGRLANIIQNNIQPDTRPPVQQKIKESKLLKNVEAQMAAENERMRGYEGEYVDDPTISLLSGGKIAAATSRPKSHEVPESLLSSIGSKLKKTYKRLSGGGKEGTYAIIPTEESEDFKTTLTKAKSDTKGTFAILPDEDEPKKKRWSMMERAKIINERNIRESIEKTDIAEAERDIALGRKPKIKMPTKPQEAYAQQLDLSNTGVEKRKSAAETIQKAIRNRKEQAIKADKSNRAITNLEKLSKKNVKKDRKLDLEGDHMLFAFREHTKDSYENIISSAKKRQKESNFKAALAMHELDKRGVQPHMTDIENELSNMMKPKQKVKASRAAIFNLSPNTLAPTPTSPQTARILDMTGGPARRFTPTTPRAPQVVDTRDIAATRLQRVVRGHSGRTKATTQLESKVAQLENKVEDTKIKANDILGDTFRQNKQKLEKKYSNRERDKLSTTKQAKLKQGIQQYADIIIAKKRGPKPK